MINDILDSGANNALKSHEVGGRNSSQDVPAKPIMSSDLLTPIATDPRPWLAAYSASALKSSAIDSATLQTLFWQQLFLKRKMLLQSKPRKGGQIRFTHQQTVELEKRFQTQKYLAPLERKRIAAKLNLSERQVKTWFQNRRAKWRRLKHTFNLSYLNAKNIELFANHNSGSGSEEQSSDTYQPESPIKE
jgi:arsenate reductase-like glutaredoxin family protein